MDRQIVAMLWDFSSAVAGSRWPCPEGSQQRTAATEASAAPAAAAASRPGACALDPDEPGRRDEQVGWPSLRHGPDEKELRQVWWGAQINYGKFRQGEDLWDARWKCFQHWRWTAVPMRGSVVPAKLHRKRSQRNPRQIFTDHHDFRWGAVQDRLG